MLLSSRLSALSTSRVSTLEHKKLAPHPDAGVRAQFAATQGARFVSFRGPIGELPQGGDGSYGTSISLYKAVEDINDVIIAYKQNGRRAGGPSSSLHC